MADKVDVLDFMGMRVELVGARKVPRYIGGETHTRAGREPVRIRLDDSLVFDCIVDGVPVTNDADTLRAMGFSNAALARVGGAA